MATLKIYPSTGYAFVVHEQSQEEGDDEAEEEAEKETAEEVVREDAKQAEGPVAEAEEEGLTVPAGSGW